MKRQSSWLRWNASAVRELRAVVQTPHVPAVFALRRVVQTPPAPAVFALRHVVKTLSAPGVLAMLTAMAVSLLLAACSPSADAPVADFPGADTVRGTGGPDASAETRAEQPAHSPRAPVSPGDTFDPGQAQPHPGRPPPAPEDPGERDKGPRVVFLGTSLTAGFGLLREEDGYVARLSAMADSAGVPMQPVNAGVSGDTSAGGLRRLEWVLREDLDILVVELGANDGLRGQDPNATAENLREIIRAARASHPGAVVLLAAMESPTNLGDAYNERFRALFPAVAQEAGAVLVPFFLEGVAGVSELNQEDGIHPTPEGHRVMARNLWPYLESALREWWDES